MAKSNTIHNGSCTLEGVLFLPDHLQKAMQGTAEKQSASDYAIPKGMDLKNDMSRYFHIATAQWKAFTLQRNKKSLDASGCRYITEEFVKGFLRDVLQYQIEASAPFVSEERVFPLSLRASKLPLIFAPYTLGLDEASPAFAIQGGSGYKKSPFQLAQELLNASSQDRWGLVTNGLRIRLLRDSTTLTRPSYLEFNLEDILANGRFAEFCQMWRVLHYTRSVVREGECIWDEWVKQGAEEGKRARESLSGNVRHALLALGNGFIQHDENEELRRKIHEGELSNEAFMRQLLRVMYRFIFLFCLEERDLLNTKGNSPEDIRARERYIRGYSLHRFRESCIRRRFKNRYSDAWDAVKIVFRSLAEGESRLALPALGGLFAKDQCPDLSMCKLTNASFFEAMEELRWDTVDGQTYPIDYKNMGSEELGGVYESLLELVPSIDTEMRSFAFVGLQVDGSDSGNARKMTGSYYTPDELVQSLLNSALEPVIDQKIQEAEKKGTDVEEALLSLTVIDPAMGSGHFCLGAARRIAKRLAEIRSFGSTPTPEAFRHALRQVIEHCIYGVDLNPMAVELGRMALWLEGYEEGKPLSFLDHHIKIGNSLVGVFDFSMFQKGIAKAAFKANRGDDKDVCKDLSKQNVQWLKYLKNKKDALAFILGEKGSQGGLFEEAHISSFVQNFVELEAKPTDTVDAIRKKRLAYEAVLKSEDMQSKRALCDLMIGAYMAPKNEDTKRLVPTTQSLCMALFGNEVPEDASRAGLEEQVKFAHQVCQDASVFHWPLEFPLVFEKGGFSIVLGNPPWDKPKVEDEKWFAARYPAIANAPKADVRKKMIAKLAEGKLAVQNLPYPDEQPVNNAEIALFNEYIEAQRASDCMIAFGHLNEGDGGRFTMTGVGDTNLFAYFSELANSLVADAGRVGMVVPTGIVTDNATQAFARHLLRGNLVSLYDFENREKFFPIDSRYRFSLLTMGKSEQMDCVFYAQNFKDIEDPRRHIEFTSEDIARMNPNTGTCPIMRSYRDMEINRKIYRNVPVLWKEHTARADDNPWGIQFLRMFDMTNDSDLFHDEPFAGCVPLYEGKLIHQFDDRYATYEVNKKGVLAERDVLPSEKTEDYAITPRYWVNSSDVQKVWKEKGYDKPRVLGFRDIASATNERTLIVTALTSKYGYGNTLPLIIPDSSIAIEDSICLIGILNSLVVDYCVRLKVNGAHINLYIIKQIPVINNKYLTEADRKFIVPRVSKLICGSAEICRAWEVSKKDMNSVNQRLSIRCEVDAYIAQRYGLTRKDLEFILDPSEAETEDYPSVTFPGLKKKEMKLYGEFRTRRLVLEAFDKLEKYGVEGFDAHSQEAAS